VLGAFFKYNVMGGNFREALAIAERGEALANKMDTPIIHTLIHAMLGLTHHLTANHEKARKHCELAMVAIDSHETSEQILRFDFDYRNVSFCALARTSWLSGDPERALRQSEQAMAWAATLQNPVNFCIALVWTISVNLMMGNLKKAEALNESLCEQAQNYSLAPYRGLSQGFKGTILIRHGHLEEGIGLILLTLRQLKAIGYKLYTSDLSSYVIEALVALGRGEEALAILNQTLEAVEVNGDSFILAELHRLKGLIATILPATALSPEICFLESIAIARAQNALAWETRATTSLASLYTRQNRGTDARKLLCEVIQKFRDGATSNDLELAGQMLSDLDQQLEPCH
jgi:tetratricopeptide (TPR) repeat protein